MNDPFARGWCIPPDIDVTDKTIDQHNINGAIWSLRDAKRPNQSKAYRDARFRDAGEHLRRLKYTRTGPEFEAILLTIDISRRRAYELMALKSQKALDNLRVATAQRVQKHREKRPNS